MMNKLHKGKPAVQKGLDSGEEQLPPLCSNKDGNGCSSSDFSPSFSSEDDALRYLARLVVSIYLEQKQREQ